MKIVIQAMWQMNCNKMRPSWWQKSFKKFIGSPDRSSKKLSLPTSAVCSRR